MVKKPTSKILKGPKVRPVGAPQTSIQTDSRPIVERRAAMVPVEPPPKVALPASELEPRTESEALALQSNPDVLSVLPILQARRSDRPESRIDPLEFPPHQCNTCEAQSVCVYFKANAACAFEETLGFKLESGMDAVNLMLELIRVDAERVKRAQLMERMMGGGMNPELSLRSDALFEKLAKLKMLAQAETPAPTGTAANGVIGQLFQSILAPRK